MKTAILINARLGSIRYPQKHLIKVLDQTMIEILVKRFLHHFEKEINENKLMIIICTSYMKINKQFLTVLEKYNVEIFFGNDGNVPYRQFRCCQTFNIDKIISICGDNFLISIDAIRKIYDNLSDAHARPVLKTVGLPIGQNVCGYTYKALKESLKNIEENSKLDTGWHAIFKIKTIKMGDYELNKKNIRMTLDYPEDATFFKTVINHFGKHIFSASDDQVMECIINNKYYKINNDLSEKYWKNFNGSCDEITKKNI